MAVEKPLLENLSLNQITTEYWNVKEAAEGCVKAKLPWISLWRHKIEEIGLAETKRIITGSGLKLSSLCRGGMFPAETAELRQKALDDNFRAVEEAAELGTDVLVLVCGPSPHKDIQTSRKWVEEGIEKLVPFAESHGVKLGIEPLHPMYAADRSVVVTLDQANTMAEKYNPNQVGVVVDVFHVWWDPDLYNQIARAEGRILGFHVSFNRTCSTLRNTLSPSARLVSTDRIGSMSGRSRQSMSAGCRPSPSCWMRTPPAASSTCIGRPIWPKTSSTSASG